MEERELEKILKRLSEKDFIDMGRFLDDLLRGQRIQVPLPDSQVSTA